MEGVTKRQCIFCRKRDSRLVVLPSCLIERIRLLLSTDLLFIITSFISTLKPKSFHASLLVKHNNACTIGNHYDSCDEN